MKTLLILLLISSQLFSQNLYLDKMLHEESIKKDYLCIGVMATTFAGLLRARKIKNKNYIMVGGIIAEVGINVHFVSKKRKIRKRFHHKNRSYKFKN